MREEEVAGRSNRPTTMGQKYTTAPHPTSLPLAPTCSHNLARATDAAPAKQGSLSRSIQLYPEEGGKHLLALLSSLPTTLTFCFLVVRAASLDRPVQHRPPPPRGMPVRVFVVEWVLVCDFRMKKGGILGGFRDKRGSLKDSRRQEAVGKSERQPLLRHR